MRVLKFGGTSMANTKLFLRAVKILENSARREQVAVVLSAPAGVTDHLVMTVEKSITGKDSTHNVNSAKLVFSKLLKELATIQSNFPLLELKSNVEKEFTQIEYTLHNIGAIYKCPDHVNAALICKGEKLSVLIMRGLLESRGHNVTVIDPVKNLLAIGHQYLNSTVDLAESARRIFTIKIPSEHIILMAGFTAGNEKKEPVVLGRNGSDYSAAILSACLHSSCCEIWTDVDGIYTYDPRYVPDAKLLRSISYQEAIALSFFGAKVLHPRTIYPIARLKIPCLIKNIRNPYSSGTLINAKSNQDKFLIKGISFLKDIMFTISRSEMKFIFNIVNIIFISTINKNFLLPINYFQSKTNIRFFSKEKNHSRTKKILKNEFYSKIKIWSVNLVSV